MRTIAVFLPNWIGDVVMATPAVRAVRSHFPGARVVGVCKSYVAETLAGSPWFDEEIRKDASPCGFLATAASIHAVRADTAILFTNSFRDALTARLGGCRTAIGFARYGRDLLLSHRLYPHRAAFGRLKPMPIIDDYNRIVQRLGIPNPGHRMELFTTPADESTAEQVWSALGLHRFRRVVGLNPGGAFGAAKHWPTAHFADLAKRLAARSGTGVLVLCGPSERAIAGEIVRMAGLDAVVGLADTPLSLGLSKALIRRLVSLVTTDSGPRHFAAAFEVPIVTLFGPTHIGWTETYFPKAVHLQQRLPCGPCQQRVCPLGHHKCMTDLLPSEVFTAVERMLPTVEEQRHAG